eukprot:m.26824 g.26824  ORF g.26824 m.26824 type:complete len:321 (+) comp13825_c1_seq1:121-1083(+)
MSLCVPTSLQAESHSRRFSPPHRGLSSIRDLGDGVVFRFQNSRPKILGFKRLAPVRVNLSPRALFIPAVHRPLRTRPSSTPQSKQPERPYRRSQTTSALNHKKHRENERPTQPQQQKSQRQKQQQTEMDIIKKFNPAKNYSVRPFSSAVRRSSSSPSSSPSPISKSNDHSSSSPFEFAVTSSRVVKPPSKFVPTIKKRERRDKKIKASSSSSPSTLPTVVAFTSVTPAADLKPKMPVPLHKPKPNNKTKTCYCCGTTTTPLWRDLESTPLCNACGIRYKKYGLHCKHCHYVPCKQERKEKLCPRCHKKLPPANKKARFPL